MSALARSSAGETEVGRIRTLYRLLAALSQARALDDMYEAALSSLLDATDADRAAILLFDDDGVMRFKASRGLSVPYQAAVTGHSPWRRGVPDARTLLVPDVQLEESLRQFRELFVTEGIRALAMIPLMLDGGVFGKFVLYYPEVHDFGTDELEIAQAIAAHVALATQHKRGEIAHLRSEQRLQAILDNSATVIFLKDLAGRYQLVNRRFEELFHVPKDKVVGRTDYDFFPPEMARQFQHNDREVLAAGKPLAIEEHLPQDDGLHTYISIKFPVTGPDGTATAIGGIATDITDREQLEAASQRLAAIVENSDDAIIGKDLNGIITSWNKGAEHIFGYTAEEILGQPISILSPPAYLDEMPELLARILQGQRVEHYETRRQRKDGHIIDVALTVSPVLDSSGRIVGASKIARDITDRKEAEKERALLLSREQEARRTAELLNRVGPRFAAQLDIERLAQEIIQVATALVGAELGTFYRTGVGEKGDSYTLYTLSDPPRETFSTFPVSPDTDLFRDTLSGGTVLRSDDITRDSRYRHCLPDVPIRSYLASPVVARSGELLGCLVFGHSVPGRFTETHETILVGIAAQAATAIDNARLFEESQWTQTELKRSNEELRRANQDLEVFAYSASHDLQEPLRTISLSAQLIERNPHQLPDEAKPLLANILTASRNMGTLIQDLLAYTRATKYEEGPPPRVDSARILSEVLDGLQVMINEAGATVSAGDLPLVAIHGTRLAQLFQNLIGNAIKYRGKEVPHVHVSAEEKNGWQVFSVADNGIGIEPQFTEQIFGLFKRLHGRDQYPGSGIGLAICQRVVEQYRGRIWVEQSTRGKGTTFCFALPIRR